MSGPLHQPKLKLTDVLENVWLDSALTQPERTKAKLDRAACRRSNALDRAVHSVGCGRAKTSLSAAQRPRWTARTESAPCAGRETFFTASTHQRGNASRTHLQPRVYSCAPQSSDRSHRRERSQQRPTSAGACLACHRIPHAYLPECAFDPLAPLDISRL
jgi:hypothetical protein